MCSSGENKGRAAWDGAGAARRVPMPQGKDSEPQCYWHLGSIIPIVRSCSALYRMFNSISGLFTLHANSTIIHPQMSCENQKCLLTLPNVLLETKSSPINSGYYRPLSVMLISLAFVLKAVKKTLSSSYKWVVFCRGGGNSEWYSTSVREMIALQA